MKVQVQSLPGPAAPSRELDAPFARPAEVDAFRTVADAAPALMWVAGVDGLRWFFNSTWLAFTGRVMEEEAGQGWSAGIHPDDRAAMLATYNAAVQARQGYEAEFRLGNSTGEYCWVLERATPLRRADRVFDGFVGMCLDITDRRESAAALIQANRALQFLADAGIELSGSLSHPDTLNSVAQLAVPAFADVCFVDLVGAPGELQRVGSAQTEELHLAVAAMTESGPTKYQPDSGAVRIISGGQPVFVPEISDTMLEAFASGPSILRPCVKLVRAR